MKTLEGFYIVLSIFLILPLDKGYVPKICGIEFYLINVIIISENFEIK